MSVLRVYVRSVTEGRCYLHLLRVDAISVLTALTLYQHWAYHLTAVLRVHVTSVLRVEVISVLRVDATSVLSVYVISVLRVDSLHQLLKWVDAISVLILHVISKKKGTCTPCSGPNKRSVAPSYKLTEQGRLTDWLANWLTDQIDWRHHWNDQLTGVTSGPTNKTDWLTNVSDWKIDWLIDWKKKKLIFCSPGCCCRV